MQPQNRCSNSTGILSDTGQITVSNDLLLARSLFVSTGGSPGTLTVAGGTAMALSNLFVGTTGGTETVWLTGGSLLGTNPSSSLVVGQCGSGQKMISDGVATFAASSLVTSSVDGGGNRTASVTLMSTSVDGSVGGIGGIGTDTAKHSYIGRLYDVSSVTVTGTPSSVNEGATSQLTGAATLDDATLLALAGSAISWTAPTYPIASIDGKCGHSRPSITVVYADARPHALRPHNSRLYLPIMNSRFLSPLIWLFFVLLVPGFGCRSTYYSAMEKFGVYKRDLLKKQVVAARDEQKEASQQFKDAMTHLKELYGFQGGDLEKTYNALKKDYDRSAAKAEGVHKRIRDVETIAEDMFNEWEGETKQISSETLRNSSRNELRETRNRYDELHTALKTAEKSMACAHCLSRSRALSQTQSQRASHRFAQGRSDQHPGGCYKVD